MSKESHLSISIFHLFRILLYYQTSILRKLYNAFSPKSGERSRDFRSLSKDLFAKKSLQLILLKEESYITGREAHRRGAEGAPFIIEILR